MARAVDHEGRKRRIVKESLKLFAAVGYAQVNFGMIAKNCGVSRTLLYTYFKNKRAIFNKAIEEVTSRVAVTYETAMATGASADAKLRRVCAAVFDQLYGNRDFICVIADVLAGYRRKGATPFEKIAQHTGGLLRVFTRILEEGIARGEFRPVDVPRAASVLYSQFEAAALRIAVTNTADPAESVAEMDAILRTLRADPTAVSRQ